MKSIVKFLLVLIGIGIVVSAWLMLKGTSLEGKSLRRREITTRILTEYVAEKFPGKKALVIANPFAREKGRADEVYAFDEAGIEGIREGWGQSPDSLIVVRPKLKPEALTDPSAIVMPVATSTPLSFLTAGDAWDSLVQQHPDADVLISLIGFPANLTETRFWNDPEGPGIALIFPDFRMLGNTEAVREAFQSGRLIAAVLDKPGAPAESDPIQKDFRKEFASRYLLITSENVEEHLAENPNLFEN